MKAFLKIVLIVIAALIAVKLLPLTLAAGCILAAGLAAIAVVGVSVLAVGICAVLAIAALLSPVWLPVLAVVGIVLLVKKSNRSNGATA